LKLKKFLPTPAGPGGETALLTTVTHLPVALLIALEHALATGGGGGAAASSPPQAANKMTLLDTIARCNARLPSDWPIGIMAFAPLKLLETDI